jgi:hypothetical protein
MTPSIALPDHYVSFAKKHELVVVAGANQAQKYWRRIRLGLGTLERPFSGTQSIEAALAIFDRAGLADRTLLAWGYGPAVDPSRTYFYRSWNATICRVRFLSREGVANTFNYSHAACVRDAATLARTLSRAAQLTGTASMLVGCSWGAAVIDCGMTQAGGMPILDGPGVAVGGPLELITRRRWLPSTHRLSANGDHGRLWVQRHPHDPIGHGGLRPLNYFLRKTIA